MTDYTRLFICPFSYILISSISKLMVKEQTQLCLFNFPHRHSEKASPTVKYSHVKNVCHTCKAQLNVEIGMFAQFISSESVKVASDHLFGLVYTGCVSSACASQNLLFWRININVC